jgi:PAS domain S-box-containing protein
MKPKSAPKGPASAARQTAPASTANGSSPIPGTGASAGGLEASEHTAERRAERTGADTRRPPRELRARQIELEIQNQELRHAREALEAALRKYSELYDFAPVGYLTLDREGTIQEANLTAAILLGGERASLVKQRLGLFISAADLPVFTAFLARIYEGGMGQFCEVELIKAGKPPVEVRISARVAASGRECHVAVTDITERKRAEEDRLVLSKLESTRILAGGLAHDFNNLLTIILLNLELAQTLIPPGGELLHLLEQAKQAALASHDLTQRLITFAKGSAPIRELTCLSGVIRKSARLAVSGSRARCDFSLAEDLRPAEVDVGQIGQVIQNLVLNAREAMPEGGVISIRAENVVLGPDEPSSLPPGDYVRVSIADRGGGMSKAVLPKIFDPYFSTKQRGNQKGMGLGLTISHTIIQKHGGAIAVESEPGVGTTFRFYLPASRKLLPKKEASVPAGPVRHARILVMDDDEELRRLLGGALRRMGHEVELVEDGQRAVEAYTSAKGRGRPFDAVILNLTVRAGVGGQEAVQSLLKLDPAVKAIVMSGYAGDPAVLEPERHGFQGVLTKPFETAKLREILSRVLGPATR